LKKKSSEIPDRILQLEGFILKENQKEKLEILIFRGFSSSTTHQIEIDSEKKVITFSYRITNFKLYKSPLTETEENFIRENQNSIFFLNQKNWI
jgi:mannose-6-phosphate isomerase class I